MISEAGSWTNLIPVNINSAELVDRAGLFRIRSTRHDDTNQSTSFLLQLLYSEFYLPLPWWWYYRFTLRFCPGLPAPDTTQDSLPAVVSQTCGETEQCRVTKQGGSFIHWGFWLFIPSQASILNYKRLCPSVCLSVTSWDLIISVQWLI